MVDSYKSLKKGIDIGEQIVTSTHNFQSKLSEIEILLWKLIDKYSKYDPNLKVFLHNILAEIKEMKKLLTTPYQGELHIVLEEEAALKKSNAWSLKFKKTLITENNKRKLEQIKADEILITILKEHFEKIKNLFNESQYLFSIDIEKVKINEIKIELNKAEEKFKKIMQNLLEIILAYENIFEEAEKRLEE